VVICRMCVGLYYRNLIGKNTNLFVDESVGVVRCDFS
jgi:hypothetical protein